MEQMVRSALKNLRSDGLHLIQPTVRPFDPIATVERLPNQMPVVQQALANVIHRVLGRPVEEREKFFLAMGRGLKQPKSVLLPEIVNGQPQITAAQLKRLRTVSVYWVTLMNWQAIDELSSSKQAYEFLRKLMPVELVGHDPERIRRMFSRSGKRFRQPGQPAKA
jgi:hypothetical protein